MSEDNTATQPVENPYAGLVGNRNGVQIPWKRCHLLRGKRNGIPYISIDPSALSESDLVKAFGLENLRKLVEVKWNNSARSACEDILGDERIKAGETTDDFTDEDKLKFQDWADGKVEDKIPISVLRKKLDEIMLTGDMENPDVMLEFMSIMAEYKARKRK